MKISFIAGLTMGAVGTALAVNKINKTDSLMKTGKKALKRKIVDALD